MEFAFVMLSVMGALLMVAVLVGVWGISIYNKLAANKNKVEEGWSGLQEQLDRHADLKADQNASEHLQLAQLNYNDAVRTLNASIKPFPANIVARMSKVVQAKVFEGEL